MGFYHVVLTTPKTSHGKLTLTVVEMKLVPDIEKSDFEEFCPKVDAIELREKSMHKIQD